MITASALMSTLFFGGYKGPAFLDALIPGVSSWPFIWFILKIAGFLFFFIWIRGTLPRMRYDQLQRFGWKVLFPIALFNTMFTAAYLAFFPSAPLWILSLLELGFVGLWVALTSRPAVKAVTAARAPLGGD